MFPNKGPDDDGGFNADSGDVVDDAKLELGVLVNKGEIWTLSVGKAGASPPSGD